jgi:hypothetical protein
MREPIKSVLVVIIQGDTLAGREPLLTTGATEMRESRFVRVASGAPENDLLLSLSKTYK